MGLFNKKKEGGIMDMIRCDEKDFLIYKWRPNHDMDVGASKKENSIRWGSSLRVRPGQAAVFLYHNKGEYDIILGPFDDILKTDNLPILAGIVGVAYAGGTPFQAEVYFINLEKGMEIPFVVPFFRVIPSEPEYKAYDIQVAIKGSMAFQVPSSPDMIKYFLEAWGMSDTRLIDFQERTRKLLVQEIKQIVSNAPNDTGIFILHMNGLIGEMGHYILSRIQERIMSRFGIFATDVIVEDIRYDEQSMGYERIKQLTEEQAHKYNLENEKTTLLSFEIQRETMRTDADVRNMSVKQMAETQLDHIKDMTERMREESQFAQRVMSEQAAKQASLGSESTYINAHSINKQSEVLKTGMENIGNMGSMNIGGGDGHMNPAGMMTGMMMGASVGQQAGQMMNQMGKTMHDNMNDAGKPQQVPPPIPNQQKKDYYLVINDEQYGPCDYNMISKMISEGSVKSDTLGWYAGLSDWLPVVEIPELKKLFSSGNVPPPIPTSKK